MLAGARAFDPAEQDYIAAHRISVPAPAVVDPDRVVAAIETTGVYLHLDVEVLDPAELHGIACPEPHGVRADALIAALAAVRARSPLTGAGLTELAPWSSGIAAGSRTTSDELETNSRSTSSSTLTVSRRLQAFHGATER